MTKPLLACAALVALATTAVGANAATLTYTGAYFSTVSHSEPPHPGSDKPPVGPYTRADRVTAVIKLGIELGANWSLKDMTPHILALHTLTDGVVDYVNVNVPYAPFPEIWLDLSTDADGNITDWGLGAVGGSMDFIGLTSAKSGDGVEYRYKTACSDPETECITSESASASSDAPGTWTVSPTVVPLPVLAGAVGLLGLMGYGRRRS